MAFYGDILTPSGWQPPRCGLLAACATGGKLSWQEVMACDWVTAPAISVESRDIRYVADFSQPLYLYGLVSDMLRRWKHSRKRLKISHRIPLSTDTAPGGVIRSLAYLEHHAGGANSPLADHVVWSVQMDNGFIRRAIGKKPVWDGNTKVFQMSADDVAMLSGIATEHSQYRWRSKTVAAAVQLAVILSGGHARERDGVVVCSKNPDRPVGITPACKVSIVSAPLWSIDVQHPLVRLEGRITIL